MNLELSDEQAQVLTRELHSIIQNDRYFAQSAHCGAEGDLGDGTAGAGARAPPPPKSYAPPTKGRYSRRR